MKEKVQYIKKNLLTATSYMVPVVVAAGITLALGTIFGGVNVSEHVGTLPYYLNKIGGLGMGIVVPVISAAIAYSISDRPGIAPGLIIGLICTDMSAGFLGGIIGGFLVGFIVNLIKKYVKVPNSMKGLMPVLIIPLLATIVSGLLMYFAIGIPIVFVMESITNFLGALDSSQLFIYGAILGMGVSFDYGGPIAKAVFLFAMSIASDTGNMAPQACVMIGCMIPPMGIIVAALLSKIFKKEIFTSPEKEMVKTCLPMGVCMITECVIPLALNDLIRTLFSSAIAGFIAGGMCMLWGVTCPVPAGGWFVFPLFGNALMGVLSLIVGSLVMGIILFLIKKPVLERKDVQHGENNGDFDELSIEF